MPMVNPTSIPIPLEKPIPQLNYLPLCLSRLCTLFRSATVELEVSSMEERARDIWFRRGASEFPAPPPKASETMSEAAGGGKASV